MDNYLKTIMELKIQHPFVDEFGVEHDTLIKHWVEDENGNPGKLLQVETGMVYDVAIDVYPSKYHYVVYYEEEENAIDSE